MESELHPWPRRRLFLAHRSGWRPAAVLAAVEAPFYIYNTLSVSRGRLTEDQRSQLGLVSRPHSCAFPCRVAVPGIRRAYLPAHGRRAPQTAERRM